MSGKAEQQLVDQKKFEEEREQMRRGVILRTVLVRLGAELKRKQNPQPQ